MTEEKVYSNVLTRGVIEFLDKKFGKTMTDEVLRRINLDRLTIMDPSGYTTGVASHALATAGMELTGEKRLLYQMGRNLPNSLGVVGGFIIGITSPHMFMKVLTGLEGRIALKTINKTIHLGGNRYRVEITFKDGFLEKPYVCENRIGCYESTPLFFGLPYAKVDHPQCVHRNEGNCIYYVEFPDYGFLWFKRAAQVGVVASIAVASVQLLTGSRSDFPVLPGSILMAALVFFSLYKHFSAKKALAWSLLANEGLIQQNQLLETTHSRVTTLQRLTARLVETGDAGQACALAVKSLVREMHFGSSQIWLLDADREFLSCAAADGYSPETTALIMASKFNYREDLDTVHGLLAQTLEQRKTIIANDVGEVLPRVSPKARAFLESLKLSSFIMTPLFHGDQPLGILAGEYHRGEKIESLDKLLFQSLGHILAGTLIKSSYPPSGKGA
jgi:hypothetical protein